MKPRYQAFTGQELLLLFCYVDSIVPFTVTWSSGDTPLDKPTKYIKSVNSSLWIPLSAFSSNDNFTCSARNIAGVTSKTTVVSIAGRFHSYSELPCVALFVCSRLEGCCLNVHSIVCGRYRRCIIKNVYSIFCFDFKDCS